MTRFIAQRTISSIRIITATHMIIWRSFWIHHKFISTDTIWTYNHSSLGWRFSPRIWLIFASQTLWILLVHMERVRWYVNRLKDFYKMSSDGIESFYTSIRWLPHEIYQVINSCFCNIASFLILYFNGSYRYHCESYIWNR